MKDKVMEFIGLMCGITLAFVIAICCVTLIALSIGIALDVLKALLGG